MTARWMKSAVLLASCGSLSPEQPDPRVLDGISDVCGEIEKLAQGVKRTLDVSALSAEIKRPQ